MLVEFKKSAATVSADPAAELPPLTRRRSRALLVVPATLLVAAAAIWWMSDRAAAVRHITVTVVAGPLVARVAANGTITPRVTVQVGSQVSGRIQEILVDFNAPVTRGQVLARLDPALFRASKAQARANLAAAHGKLAKARARARNASKFLTRARALVARDLIAGADIDNAEAEAAVWRGDISASRGDVAQARAALRQAEVNLAYTTITSPVDGIVISRNVDVGQTVAASLQAPTLFSIAEDLRSLQVHTNVPEADVGKLSAGMKTTFTVDAYPDEKWQGLVREVRNAAQASQGVVTYDAVVDVQNDGARLRPGMTATVSFVYAERPRAITIPNLALRYRPRKDDSAAARVRPRDGESVVYVLVKGAPIPRQVRLGISDGKITEIVAGEVHPGDRVIIDERTDDGKREAGRRLPSRL